MSRNQSWFLIVLGVAIIVVTTFFWLSGYKVSDDSATEMPLITVAAGDIEGAVVKTEPEAAVEAPSWTAPTGFDPYTERAMGNPDAPVKIVEYSSLTCGHCAHFHKDTLPEIKKNYIDTGKVYFVFHEFPLNAPALAGVLAARCLPIERYVPFIDFLFENMEQWAYNKDYVAILKENAKLLGVNEDSLDQCAQDEKLRDLIAKNMKEAGDKYNVNATPSFVINDKEVLRGAQPFYVFRDEIEAALAAHDAPSQQNAPDQAAESVEPAE